MFAEIKRFYKHVSIAKANGNLHLQLACNTCILFFCLNASISLLGGIDPGKSWKSFNFKITFSGPGKSWNLVYILESPGK